MNAKKKANLKDIEPKPIVGSDNVQVSQINKPMVFSLIGIVVIILVFIIIDSMQTPQTQHHSSGPAPKKQGMGLKKSAIKKEVSSLPGSYQDGAQINKMLHRDFKSKSPSIPAAFKRELETLRNSQYF